MKQCIEFHYMPKVNLTSRKISPKATSSVITRRKRIQMINDETSSSPINDSRLVSLFISDLISNECFLSSRAMMIIQ